MKGLLDLLLGGGETRGQVDTAHPKDPRLATLFGIGADTYSGVSVTPDTAMRQSSVYACVSVLGQTLAALPLKVWRRTDDGKVEDPAHPLWSLLHDEPNAVQTSFEWRETAVAHTALRGSAYARIRERNDGRVMALEPLHPDRVTAFRAPDGRIAFRHVPERGGEEILLDNEVLRFPGLSDDGVAGLSPIALHRETVGTALAAQRYGARFFANNAAPKGGIQVPTALDDEAAATLRESWERRHKGIENQHKLAIFDGGMEWVDVGMSNEDAQYLEIMQFEAVDIARIFRVPPHKIGILDRATFSNIEQQNIEFVTDTILPWVRRLESRLNRSLLTPAGRATHYIGFEIKGLLRGDSKARGELYRQLFNAGALSPNDIRRLEDMRPVAGGDTYYVPLNMSPADIAADVLLRHGGTGSPAPETRTDDDEETDHERDQD